MCEEIMHVRKAVFFFIPDRLKTLKMCIGAVKGDPWQLYDVPNWFVVLQKMWYEDRDENNEIIQLYEGYKKHKPRKANIKEELLSIAWHPDCVMDWCMSEDEKR